jgi:Ca-activated chloride channel homolog
LTLVLVRIQEVQSSFKLAIFFGGIFQMRKQILINAKFFTALVLLASMIFSACSSYESTSNTNASVADRSRAPVSMSNMAANSNMATSGTPFMEAQVEKGSGERYAEITENPFLETSRAPLSTFSIDVDTASYANVRRFLNDGQLPPKDAVRIEELINYFEYDYPQPVGDVPFSVNTEVATAPWNAKHKIVQIGLQGKKVSLDNVPPSNLVFLLDVSGSMNSYDKLPLLKESLRILVNQLKPQDRVAIAVYAGASGLVLPSTSAADKGEIFAALENLQAGGSTNGGAGIQLAYTVALNNFIQGGNNRVILATDGDFNVGLSGDDELVRMIEEKTPERSFSVGFRIRKRKPERFDDGKARR